MREIVLHQGLYLIIGLFAGLMSGILGIGGGVIVVPALVFIFQYNHLVPADVIMHVAAGTSLAVMIFTSLASLSAHYKMGEILWQVFNKLWPGIILGVCVGAFTAQFIPTLWLKIIFALFLLFVAFKMFVDRDKAQVRATPKMLYHHLVSLFIGFKSGLLGVGGGVLVIPYLTFSGVPVRKIAPVSNLCTFTVAIVGSLVFMATGYREMAAVAYATGYVYWPAVLSVALASAVIAPIGAKLNYILPVKQLKYVFIIILILTALKMLF